MLNEQKALEDFEFAALESLGSMENNPAQSQSPSFESSASSTISNDSSSDANCRHHFFFVVHGMGQRKLRFMQNMESLEMISENVKSSIDDKYHFLPIEWHTKLHALTSVDARMKKVTLGTVKVLREINNEYLADTMYYFTEYHGQKIVEIILNQINSTFETLTQKYNTQDATWHMLGHSLGGVICYDILSQDHIRNRLSVVPSTLFTIGSPVSAVMVMRGTNPHDHRPPSPIRYFNIYDPFDPLAYRFEPLFYETANDDIEEDLKDPVAINPFVSSVTSFPVNIVLPSFTSLLSFASTSVATNTTLAPSSNLTNLENDRSSLKRARTMPTEVLNATIQESETQTSPVAQQSFFSSFTNNLSYKWLVGLLTYSNFLQKTNEGEEVVVAEEKYVQTSSIDTEKSPQLSPVQKSLKELNVQENEMKSNKTRFDYQLQVNFMKNINNEYINGISAHFSYWTSTDMVNFIIEKIDEMN